MTDKKLQKLVQRILRVISILETTEHKGHYLQLTLRHPLPSNVVTEHGLRESLMKTSLVWRGRWRSPPFTGVGIVLHEVTQDNCRDLLHILEALGVEFTRVIRSRFSYTLVLVLLNGEVYYIPRTSQ